MVYFEYINPEKSADTVGLHIKNGFLYLEIPNPYSNPLNDPTHLNLYSEKTIRYILESCKYKVLNIEQRGLYKRGTLMRNNRNLNLHVLAKSMNEKKPNFNKIMIGKKVYSELLNKRKIIGLKIFLQQLNYLFSSIIRTTYSFIFLILNYFFSNFAVKLHNFFKRFLK